MSHNFTFFFQSYFASYCVTFSSWNVSIVIGWLVTWQQINNICLFVYTFISPVMAWVMNFASSCAFCTNVCMADVSVSLVVESNLVKQIKHHFDHLNEFFFEYWSFLFLISSSSVTITPMHYLGLRSHRLDRMSPLWFHIRIITDL